MAYQTTLHPTYKGSFNLNLSTRSTYKEAYFSFQFKQNNVVSTGNSDVYTIEMPAACHISTKNASLIGGTLDKVNNTITYTGPLDDSGIISIDCDVEGIIKKGTGNSKDKIYVPITIKENVKEQEFVYKDSVYVQNLSDYYKKYPLPEVKNNIEWKWTEDEKYLILPDPNTLPKEDYFAYLTQYLQADKTPLDGKDFTWTTIGGKRYTKYKNYIIDDIYDVFNIIWLQNIVPNINDGSIDNQKIIDYVKTVYKDEASLLNETNELRGLKISKYNVGSDNKVIYKYEITENFLGYVKTYDFQNRINPYTMYFSTENQEEIDSAFAYYLKNYTYKDSETNYDLVLKYIESFDPNRKNGISYILQNGSVVNNQITINGKVVQGLYYYPEQKRIRLDANILAYAQSKVNKEVVVPFGTDSSMITFFRNNMKEVYSDIISDKTIDAISLPPHKIFEYITKYAKNDGTIDTGLAPYNEYDTIYEKFINEEGIEIENYVLINIYSDGNSTYAKANSSMSDTTSISFKFENKSEVDKQKAIATIEDCLKKQGVSTDKKEIKEIDDYVEVRYIIKEEPIITTENTAILETEEIVKEENNSSDEEVVDSEILLDADLEDNIDSLNPSHKEEIDLDTTNIKDSTLSPEKENPEMKENNLPNQTSEEDTILADTSENKLVEPEETAEINTIPNDTSDVDTGPTNSGTNDLSIKNAEEVKTMVEPLNQVEILSEIIQ